VLPAAGIADGRVAGTLAGALATLAGLVAPSGAGAPQVGHGARHVRVGSAVGVGGIAPLGPPLLGGIALGHVDSSGRSGTRPIVQVVCPINTIALML
jgi:hypothetical protein